MSNERKTVHIKLRVGKIEFEVDCQPDQLRPAIENFLSAVGGTPSIETLTAQQTPPAPEKPTIVRSETCKSLTLDLWRESWFSEPRTLSQVHDELSRRGYNYDRTAVAHTLVDLVRENVLTRQGQARRYKYIQKKPAI